MNKYIEATQNGLVHTYNQFPIVLEKGEGVYLYDTEGKSIWILLQAMQYRLLDMAIRN